MSMQSRIVPGGSLCQPCRCRLSHAGKARRQSLSTSARQEDNGAGAFAENAPASYGSDSPPGGDAGRTDDGVRRNHFNIQMLPQNMREALFGKRAKGDGLSNIVSIMKARGELQKRFPLSTSAETLDYPDVKLPPLEGEDIAEHFINIGRDQCHPYIEFADSLVKMTNAPVMPKTWRFEAGWFKYTDEHPEGVPVEFPDEKVLVFDVEVWKEVFDTPVLATAMSPTAWYSWTSEVLTHGKSAHLHGGKVISGQSDRSALIPLTAPANAGEEFEYTNRLVIGHNVSFDRAYVREEYQLAGTKTRYLDTLSMHVVSGGLNAIQKGLFTADQKRQKMQSENTLVDAMFEKPEPAKVGIADKDSDVSQVLYRKSDGEEEERPKWMDAGCPNSLKALYEFHCGKVLDKAAVEIFMSAKSLSEIRERYQEGMTYCAKDVQATFEVFQEVFPKMMEHAAHPCSLAGVLQMGSCYLPVDTSWQRYINRSEQMYQELQGSMTRNLMNLANSACAIADHKDIIKADPWLYPLDWSRPPLQALPKIYSNMLFNLAQEKKAWETMMRREKREQNREDTRKKIAREDVATVAETTSGGALTAAPVISGNDSSVFASDKHQPDSSLVESVNSLTSSSDFSSSSAGPSPALIVVEKRLSAVKQLHRNLSKQLAGSEVSMKASVVHHEAVMKGMVKVKKQLLAEVTLCLARLEPLVERNRYEQGTSATGEQATQSAHSVTGDVASGAIDSSGREPSENGQVHSRSDRALLVATYDKLKESCLAGSSASWHLRVGALSKFVPTEAQLLQSIYAKLRVCGLKEQKELQRMADVQKSHQRLQARFAACKEELTAVLSEKEKVLSKPVDMGYVARVRAVVLANIEDTVTRTSSRQPTSTAFLDFADTAGTSALPDQPVALAASSSVAAVPPGPVHKEAALRDVAQPVDVHKGISEVTTAATEARQTDKLAAVLADSGGVESVNVNNRQAVSSALSYCRSVRMPHMMNYPEWYRRASPPIFRGGRHAPSSLTATKLVSPLLLRLMWDGKPLHYTRDYGWGWIFPSVCCRQVKAGELTAKADQSVLCSTDGGRAASPEEASARRFIRAVKTLSSVELRDSVDSADDQSRSPTGGSNHALGNNSSYTATSSWWSPTSTQSSEPLDTVRVLNPPDMVIDHPHYGKLNFYRLPHKDGPRKNVGSPLAKSFFFKMEDGTLRSADASSGTALLRYNSQISYWRLSRYRIRNQLVFSLGEQGLPQDIKSHPQFNPHESYAAILPRLVVCGTITRRGVEPCWLTVSNAQEDRVGSELKSMVRSPPGYRFVGADVDSEELWICGLLADCHSAREHGCTAIGWMNLQGNKADGTDVHSQTAAAIGITRNAAKTFNYARFYGAGQRHAANLLMQFNHNLSRAEAQQRATHLFNITKGRKMAQLTTDGLNLAKKQGIPVDSQNCTAFKNIDLLEPRAPNFDDRKRDTIELAGVGDEVEVDPEDMEQIRKNRRRLYRKTFFGGGSESHLFNHLEKIIKKRRPITPALGVIAPKTILRENVEAAFKPCRINWIVQSSGVDFLHCLLVSMKWMMDKYDIKGRLSLSIHDEVRFLVREEDQYRAALALHYSNLLTRSLFAYQLGMSDLPESVAYFSQVDIDFCLRKEVDEDCKSPSNPFGLKRGHGLPYGEAVNIHDTLKHTNGSLEKATPGSAATEEHASGSG